jgi:hypothetical protein
MLELNARLPHLETLVLIFNNARQQLEQRHVDAMSRLSSLRSLSVQANVSGATFAPLAALEQLAELRLLQSEHSTGLTDAHVESLAELYSLEVLEFPGHASSFTGEPSPPPPAPPSLLPRLTPSTALHLRLHLHPGRSRQHPAPPAHAGPDPAPPRRPQAPRSGRWRSWRSCAHCVSPGRTGPVTPTRCAARRAPRCRRCCAPPPPPAAPWTWRWRCPTPTGSPTCWAAPPPRPRPRPAAAPARPPPQRPPPCRPACARRRPRSRSRAWRRCLSKAGWCAWTWSWSTR